jgi:tetratricopeptide (TPR) repeat protein
MSHDPREEALQHASSLAAAGDLSSAVLTLAETIYARRAAIFDAPTDADEIDEKMLEVAFAFAAAAGERETARLYGDALDRRLAVSEQSGKRARWTAERTATALQLGAIDDAERIFAALDPSYPGYLLEGESVEEAVAALAERTWFVPLDANTRAEVARSVGLHLAALGRFEVAAAVARSGRGWIEAPDDATETGGALWLGLALLEAEARLWRGATEAAAEILEDVARRGPAERPPPIAMELERVRALHLQLSGQLGRCKQALLRHFDASQRFGISAARHSALNLAEFLLTLNQSTLALEILRSAGEPRGSGEERFDRRAVLEKRSWRLAESLGQKVTAANAEIYSVEETRDPIDPLAVVSARSDLTGALASSVIAGCATVLAAAARAGGVEDATLRATEEALDTLSRRVAFSDSPVLRALTLFAAASYRVSQGRSEDARTILLHALQILPRGAAELPRWECLRLLAELDRAVGSPADGAFEEAADLLQTLQRSLETPEERDVFLLGKESLGDHALVATLGALARLQRQGSAPARVSRAALAASPPGAASLRAALRLSKERADDGTVDPLGSWPSPDCVTLRIVPSAGGTLVVLTLADALLWRVAPIAAPALRLLCRQWHERNSTFPSELEFAPDGSRAAHSVAALDDLFRTISRVLDLEPMLSDVPAGVTRLRILAYDAPHTMPFEAMPFAAGYLDERFDIEHAVDGYCAHRDATAPSRGMAFALPDPVSCVRFDDGTRREVRLPGLRAVERETNEVLERMMRRMRLRTSAGIRAESAEARRREILDSLYTADYVHIASHGYFFPERPGESGLVVAGRPGGEAVMLSLRALSRASRRIRARHVGLSACFSADALRFAGRRAKSLPGALCGAGVQAVAAFLWPVEDLLAAESFARYYDNLADKGPTRAASACRAALRNRGGKDGGSRAHPYFWAGLTVWTPMDG